MTTVTPEGPRYADHHLLDLGGALADQEQWRVAVDALDLVLLRVAIAAVNAERLLGVLVSRLGGEQLRHAGLDVRALAGVLHRAAFMVSSLAASTLVPSPQA